MSNQPEEVLIHRAIELTASAADWADLDAAALRDPAVLQRLASALQDEGDLRRGVEERLAAAERVALPQAKARRLPRAPAWLGWAAAAALALIWSASGFLDEPAKHASPLRDAGSPAPERGPALAGDGVLSLDDLRLVSNDTLGELPSMMLETRPAADGRGYEVIRLRRTLERLHVDQIFRVAEDEHGNAVPAQWTPPVLSERM